MLASREETEQQSRYELVTQKNRINGCSLFLDNLLDIKVREFNPQYAETEDAFLDQFQQFHTHTNRIPMLVSECKNANWDETITLQLEFL